MPSRTSSADAVPAHPRVPLPSQVSPPDFALSAAPPHAVSGSRWWPCRSSRARTATRTAARTGCGRPRRRARDRPARRARGRRRPPGEPARSPPCRCRSVRPDNADLRRRAAGRRRCAARAATSAGPAPRWRGRPATAARWRRRSRRSRPTWRSTPFVVGAMLGSFALPLALGPARAPTGRAGWCSPTCPTTSGPALARAVAVGGAGWRSRMLATVPSNLKNPPGSPSRPETLADEAGLDCHGLGRAAARRRGLRRHPRRRPGLGDAAAADPPRLRAAQGRPSYAHGRAGRQGHHLRHRRPLDQARRGDGQHEARHDRRRRRPRDDGRARRGRLPGPGRRAGRRRRERRRRQRAAPRRRRPPLRRPHHRGHQHRRRGPAGARRRARVRRRRDQARRRRRRRHPDRRDEGRARASRSAASSPTTTRSPP